MNLRGVIYFSLLFSFSQLSFSQSVKNPEIISELKTYIEENIDEDDMVQEDLFLLGDSKSTEVSIDEILPAVGVELDENSDLTSVSACYKEYHKKVVKLNIKSKIIPVITTGTVPLVSMTGTYLGQYLGQIVTGSAGWGSIMGSSWGTVIGFSGGIAYFAVKEFIVVSKLIDIRRMQLILKEVYLDGDKKMLKKIQKKLNVNHLSLSLDQISKIIMRMDQDQELCRYQSAISKSITLVGYKKLLKNLKHEAAQSKKK